MPRAAWAVLALLLSGCAEPRDGAAAAPPARVVSLLFEENVTVGARLAGRGAGEGERDVFPACPLGATGILLEMRWRDGTPPAPRTLFLEAVADGRAIQRTESDGPTLRVQLPDGACARGPLVARFGLAGTTALPTVALGARVTLAATAFLDGPADWSYSALPRG